MISLLGYPIGIIANGLISSPNLNNSLTFFILSSKGAISNQTAPKPKFVAYNKIFSAQADKSISIFSGYLHNLLLPNIIMAYLAVLTGVE